MAKSYTVRANFPTQGADLVQVVEAGGWPAALGLAARRMRNQLKGRRVKIASFTISQNEGAGMVTSGESSSTQQGLPIEQESGEAEPENES